MTKEYEKIIDAAKAGGEVIKKYFGEALEVEQKSIAADVRTKADTESEEAIVKILKENFPEYGIHSEEMGKQENESGYLFIIDPLDGSNNFTLGIPNFTVSIGLVYDKEIIFGVVHNPISGQLFYAEKGSGAFENGHKIHVGAENDLSRSTIGYVCNYVHDKVYEVNVLKTFAEKDVKRVLYTWSPAFDYCLLAAGRIEAMITDKPDIYDYIAGKLIAKEAGAKTTDLSGNFETDERNDQFLISNGTSLHKEILEVLKSVREGS